MVITSEAHFEGSRFFGNTADSAADIHAQGNGYVDLQYVHFENSVV